MIYVAVVTIYVLLLLGVSVYKSRTVRTDEDFMVAGRGVPVYLLVATLVCTWIGSGSLFGTAGLTFRTGVSELWFSAGAWIGILVVYTIASRVRRIAQYTLTDLLEKRYSQLAKVLGTITIIIAYMVIAGYQFKGGGRFISILSEGSISPEAGMLIAAALIVGFTVLAGMVSIVSIDIFNGIIMLLAMVVTLPFAVMSHGGIGAVVTTIQQASPSHLEPMGGHDFLWVAGIALPTFLLLMSESSIYQKFSSADSARNARRAVMGMFIGVVMVETLMMLIALVGFAIYADDPRFFFADGSINRAMAEEIILRIGFEQLPTVIGSLLLAAGAAILISTGNTFLMVTSTNVTRDILQAFFYRDATPSQVVWLQRGCIVVIGILAYLMMSQFETILGHADRNRHHGAEFGARRESGDDPGDSIPDGYGLHRHTGGHRLRNDTRDCQPADATSRRGRLAGVHWGPRFGERLSRQHKRALALHSAPLAPTTFQAQVASSPL